MYYTYTHIRVCVKKRLLGCPPDIESTAVTHAARHPSPICGNSTLILLGPPLSQTLWLIMGLPCFHKRSHTCWIRLARVEPRSYLLV